MEDCAFSVFMRGDSSSLLMQVMQKIPYFLSLGRCIFDRFVSVNLENTGVWLDVRRIGIGSGLLGIEWGRFEILLFEVEDFDPHKEDKKRLAALWAAYL